GGRCGGAAGDHRGPVDHGRGRRDRDLGRAPDRGKQRLTPPVSSANPGNPHAAAGTRAACGVRWAGPTVVSAPWRTIGVMSESAQNSQLQFNIPRRPRRLRTTPVMRDFTAETSLNPSQLVLPLLVADGLPEPQPIRALPGVYQHTTDSLLRAVEEAAEAGVGSIDLVGVPLDEDKDATGSVGVDPEGILNK